jgi:hypothetical protein
MDAVTSWCEYFCGADETAESRGATWCKPLGEVLERNGVLEPSDLEGLSVSELNPMPTAVHSFSHPPQPLDFNRHVLTARASH